MKLHCTKIGNPKGRPIIFLHGLFGSSKDFSFLIPELKTKRSLHFWDLPGHGRSDSQSFSSFEDFGRYFFKELGNFEQKPDLVGYSLGGRIGLFLIANFPNSFHKAIIISANPGIISETERLKRWERDKILLDDLKFPEFFLRNWFKAPLFGNISNHPKFNELLKTRMENNFSKIKNCLPYLSVGSQIPLWDKLNKFACPILYLTGEKDDKYDFFAQELKKIPFIKTQTFPNCGHNLIFENPNLFLNILSNFLR